MDPKTNDSTWRSMKPPAKLEVLRRYRDKSLKNDERFLTAQDFFIENVLEEGLEQDLMNDINFNNRS
jgi:hypothetical protein